MRRIIVLIAACIALAFFAGDASATKITPEQVIAICGDKLQSGGVPGAHASGCEQKCGTEICTYNCCNGPKCGEEGCHGHVVAKRPLPASVLKQLNRMSPATR